MRRCLIRNYRGSNHIGAAADYEDPMVLNKENVMSPSKALIVAAEAISMEVVNEDDEQEGIGHVEGKDDGLEPQQEIQTRLSETGEQPLQATDGSTESPITGDQDFAQNPSVIAPGYVPSENDERILLELPASMVRPLTVLRGMFQVRFVLVSDDVHSLCPRSLIISPFCSLKI